MHDDGTNYAIQLGAYGFGTTQVVLYLFAKAGDVIPIHFHNFDHVSGAAVGNFEAEDDEGKIVAFGMGSPGVLFPAGKAHVIRAVTDQSVLVNIETVSDKTTTTRDGRETRYFVPQKPNVTF